ncbi:MAG TPA: host specificity factor TipJ family phage tail protein [Modicisalibacter sp.]|nr:host specificity factor TipJ family phage tail protein [Modicisalibacter sp.]
MRIIAANHPLRSGIVDRCIQDGLNLEQILVEAQPDPILRAHAYVFVGDVKVPRERWSRVRPKASSLVTIKVVAQGGGGGSKNPLRTILTIAVVVFAPQVAPLLGVTSTLGAAVLTAGVTAVGMLAVNAIAPIRPPSIDGRSGTTKRDSPTLSIEGARNNARPFGVIPVVLGKHRHVPPLGAKSYTEVVGDDQYLRMLVVWGYGPLKIENLRIGETPIGDFDNVRIQTREGRPGDAPVTLFPSQVDQEDIAIALKQSASWQQRTSDPNADELSVDVTLPRGLVRFDDEGERHARSVSLFIEYRPTTGGAWLTPSYSDTTVPSNWIRQSDGLVTLTHNRTSAVRHGFRWSVPRGQYEIRLRRTTADTNDTQIIDTLQWTAYRTITNEDPINFAYPLAVTALSIKATDQLNGVVDQLTADVSSYVTDWDGTEVVSNNPALLYRHVLQGNANARRLDDSRVDLAALEAWGDYCDEQGFEFDMIRDFQSSVWDTLADIGAAGRGSPSQRDGKWAVVVDKPQDFPVQHFTPRNSWGFEAEKTFPDPPDAFRIRFASRESDYRQDERIVYADGFSAANAEVFETLDAPGITAPSHIWKFGRFHLAQSLLRPERWTLNLDFEHLVARRGSRVRVTHDVLLVGLASGRIKDVLTDIDGNATGFVSDEVLSMESGKAYGVSIRTVGDAGLSRELVTVEGDNTSVEFASPIPAAAAPSVGDLFGFGESGKETIDALVLSIEPQSDFVARLVLIPYSPAVYDADTGTIPAFDPGITPLPAIPDVEVGGVRSDESVLQLGSGLTLIPHIAVSVAGPSYRGLQLDIQIRASGTGEPFADATLAGRTGNDYLLGNVRQGDSYDLRVRWNDPSRVTPGRWTDINSHRVVGQTNPPQGLQGITIAAFGGSALLRWDRLSELDVRFGGEIRFRHSPATNVDSATWASSTSIGEAAKGDSLFAQLPLKPGTYLARVFDRGGRPSTEVAKISTKQASVLDYANLDEVIESPTFSGEKIDVVVSDGSLFIEARDLVDDIPDWDAIPSLDSIGGIAEGGTYNFAGGFDFLSVTKTRLTSRIEAISVNVFELMDSKSGNIDDWENFDGTEQAQADARVQVRHTDDDPAATPVWSVWNNLDAAEYEARAFEFRVILTTNDPAYNIRIDELSVKAEELF